MLYYIAWVVSYIVLTFVYRLMGRLRVTKLSPLPRGGVIICPNHLSFCDPPLIGYTCGRFCWYMGTDELFPMGWLGKIARLMRTYPVKQDSPDRKALRFTEDLLKRGEAVVIFPEGHVSPHGKLFPLQGGVIMMALRAGVPIVPVGIRNTEQMMPYRTFKLKRPTSPLEVIYGVPLTPEELSGGMKGRAAIDHGTQKLTAAILALSGQELSDQPWSIEMTGREDTPKSVA